VPYDDNNLTKAMRDSIGGRARTLMIVSMGPSEYDLQETMDSLKFAQTTGQIKNIVEQQSTLMIPLSTFFRYLKYEMFSYIKLTETSYELLFHKHTVTRKANDSNICNARYKEHEGKDGLGYCFVAEVGA